MREDVVKAAAILNRWGVVALPTETVYGLAADARNEFAVRRIFELKGRPSFNPLIVHVKDLEMAEGIGEFSPLSQRLAKVFWPGPLTIVVPLRAGAGVSSLVTAGRETIALRAPAHPLMQMVLSLSGLALAAPSANISGRVSPTSADHVRENLPEVDYILDGGACARGLESTIVMAGADDKEILLLRPGPVTLNALEGTSGLPVRQPEMDAKAPLAPGALLKHYSPRALVKLNVTGPVMEGGLLGFAAEEEGFDGPFYQLSERGDLEEAGSNLFAGLSWLEAQGVEVIFVRPIPEGGVGAAINDRLIRAAVVDEAV